MAAVEGRHWWFVGRRAVIRRLLVGLSLPRDAAILEAGCGTGGNLRLLSEFGRVSCFEADATARAFAQERWGGEVRAGSCPDQIPFQEQFDLICMLDVLEHVEEDVRTLSELRKRLRPDGKLLVTVPAHQWLWSVHDEVLHHKRRYSVPDLRDKAGAAGLTVSRLTFFNAFLFPLAVATRLYERVLRRQSAVGASLPPRWINAVFTSLLVAESRLIARTPLPLGLSIAAVLEPVTAPRR